MKRLAALFLLVVGLATAHAPAWAASRVALVIANSTYDAAGKLVNPPADAALVAGSLRRAGFQIVEVKQDLGKVAMERALRDFGEQADGAEVALVYYAGHGIEAGGENYLIPTDARLARDRDLEVEATRLETVLRQSEGARMRIIVLDACRNNPFVAQMQRSARSRSIGRGLAMVEPEGETLVVYAAKAGATAADGSGRNSPFAEALAKRLAQPGLEISLLFRAVRDDVLAKTGRQQEPFTYGSLSGNAFYFIAPTVNVQVQPAPAPAPRQDITVSGEAQESLYWQGVLAANSENGYANYLKRYPKGTFEDIARENLTRLRVAKATPPPRQEKVEVASLPSKAASYPPIANAPIANAPVANAPAPARNARSLIIGNWVTAAPVRRSQDGLTIEIRKGRVSYTADNQGLLSGVMVISGAAIPGGSMIFDVAGRFTWLVDGNLLNERIVEARVTPRLRTPEAQLLAEALRTEMANNSSNYGDILDIGQASMRIRERNDGTVVQYRREGSAAAD